MSIQEKQEQWIRLDGNSNGLARLRGAELDLANRKIELCEQDVAAARKSGDCHKEGQALLKLGAAWSSLGDQQQELMHYTQALGIFREIGDRGEEANVLSHLGTAYSLQRDATHALQYHTQALAIYEAINDRAGSAKQHNILGSLYLSFGIPQQVQVAVDQYQLALSSYQELADRKHETIVLGNLGAGYLLLGQAKRAIQYQTQALGIAREAGDRHDECTALYNLGTDYISLGQSERALERLEQALGISREISDRSREAMVLGNMGTAYHQLRQIEKAIEVIQAAAQIYEEIGGPGADRAREQLRTMQAQKAKKTPRGLAFLIGLLVVTFIAVFWGLNSSTTNNLVSIAEAYRNAPTSSTQRQDWQYWESQYIGKNVRGTGQVIESSIHPQTGKLFFIITLVGAEGTPENGTTQVALLVENAHTVNLGEKEGSFLIDGTQWINLGENYAFDGKVSGFSLFDADLVGAGHRNVIIVKAKVKDIRKE